MIPNIASLLRVSCDPAPACTAPLGIVTTGLMLIFSLELSAGTFTASLTGVSTVSAAKIAAHIETVIKLEKPRFDMTFLLLPFWG
jgi:hypothetical protein